MRILVGKTFGIGNAVLSVPMVKAIRSMGHGIDVLVGNTPDDFGAWDVFYSLKRLGVIDNLHFDLAPNDVTYDVAIMAIPFDGRWQNGHHFKATSVLDGRKRPGNIERLGFDMWEKHEVEYQMENARELGYTDPTPDCSFTSPETLLDENRVYVGLGFKRDPGGFGQSKHFGNGRFAQLLLKIRELNPLAHFVSTGSATDMVHTWYQIVKVIGPEYAGFYRFPIPNGLLLSSFEELAHCKAYIGNDTGFMHVAASMNKPTCGLFTYADLITKNPPFCDRSKSILFGADFPSVDYIAEEFVRFVWG